jgi:spermidine synthase
MLSGASGLLCESSWTRLLHQVFGVSDLAVATVLASFFLGLGLGSAIGGRWAARVTRPALAYAAIELGVAALALLSLAWVPAVRSAYEGMGNASFGALTLARWALASLVLLPPTLLMGATLPILARAASGADWSRAVTNLYVANTAGAILGAAAAGFWTIPLLGVRASIALAASGSVAAAVIVYACFRGEMSIVAPAPPLRDPRAPAGSDARVPDAAGPVPGPGDADAAGSAPAAPEETRRLLRSATLLSGLSGFTALAGEVLWTRVLRIVVHGTTAAFAAMLVSYLTGIVIGAGLAPRLAKRWGAARSFGALQVAVVVATGLAMAFAPMVPRLVVLLRGGAGPVPHETWVLLLVSGTLLLPTAILTGTGLPLAWAIGQEATGESGRASGRLLAANTLGGLAGALAAGFFLVPALGTEASLIAVAAVAALASAIAFRVSVRTPHLAVRVASATAPFGVLVLVLLAQPSIALPYLLAVGQMPIPAILAGPGGPGDPDLVFLREGRNTTVSIARGPEGLMLYNDGRPESGFVLGEPGFSPELAALGVLPALFAERRGEAAVIGLGAGHTVAVALATGFSRVDAIELEEAVVEGARLLYDARERPFPLDDPRARLLVDDGRDWIARAAPSSFDAVISQPSHPWLAGSGALYTREFFDEVSRALRPGGVFALWVNLFRMDLATLRSVIGTLSDAFAHVLVFVVDPFSVVMAASQSPFDWERAGARLEEIPATPLFLRPHRLDTLPLLAASVELDTEGARLFGERAARIHDDRPVLEFRMAALPQNAQLGLDRIDRALRAVPWISSENALARHPRFSEILAARIEASTARAAALARLAPVLERMVDAPEPVRTVLAARMAEARGDVGGALRGYDAAGTREAAFEADRLRLAEGLFEDALAAARRRLEQEDGLLPARAGPLLEAALALDRPDALALAVDVADRIADPDDAALRDFAAAQGRGCGALRAFPALEAVARVSLHAAMAAERCALAVGDLDAAHRFDQTEWRLRAAAANRWSAMADVVSRGGNGGHAWMLYRRALRMHPSSSRAAVGLARLAARDGRLPFAARVLRDAWAATEGLEEAHRRIAVAAQALGIDLGAPLPAERAPASGAPVSPRDVAASQPDAP